jgi:uncharacterized protein YdeI (YjbR/CyaY-like superfamily)
MAAMNSSVDISVTARISQRVEANPQARATFRTLGRLNLFALAFRTNAMKTPAGRAKKIAAFVSMLARGEAFVPEPARRRRRRP